MELEEMILENVVKKLDLEEGSLDGFTNDTVIFNFGDGRTSLGLDSVDTLEMVTLIYENWHIEVPAEDIRQLYSVNTIAAYIRSHRNDS